MQTQLERAQWSSYHSYVLVTTGAVVGLGNIFNFPFFIAQYGGLFLLFYLLSEILISIPLLFAELTIGRRGKQNPVGSISILVMESGASRHWRLIGWLCFIILFLTLTYYAILVAQPLNYFFSSLSQAWGENQHSFISITGQFFPLAICFFLFLLATMLVILRGINRGLETISLIIVPTYFVILLGLAIYASVSGDLSAAVNYLFHIPSDQPIWPVFFTALIFAFFKLNIGMGSMIVYGSYLPYSVPLAQSTFIIIILDLIASLLAYFVISPLMLSYSPLIPGNPVTTADVMAIFSFSPHGNILSILFFLVAIIASWTATIAMAESATLILIERLDLSRAKATFIIGLSALIVGLFLVFANIQWPDVLLFNTWTIPEFVRNFASDFATPISAFLIAIFIGWIVTTHITREELNFPTSVYVIWHTLVRFLIPIAIATVFILIAFT